MSELEEILGYRGEIEFETIDPLLERLKKLSAYQKIKRPTRKKVYSIFIECLENIIKHTIIDAVHVNDRTLIPFINLGIQDDKYIISTGNAIPNKNISELKKRLEQINQLDKAGLKKSFAKIINSEFPSDLEGAGLGLITIALKSETKIIYKFTPINDQYSYFEMQISI